MSMYVKRVQRRLKENIEAGNLNLGQQFAVIDAAIDDLLSVNAINEKAVEQHDHIVEESTTLIVDKQKEIADRYHKTYEEILKL